MTIDALTLAIVRGGIEQIAEEMDITLKRAAFSPVIAEANDMANILENMVSTTNHTWFSIERHNLETADELYRNGELIAYILIPEGCIETSGVA